MRINVFEFEDFKWFPDFLRRAMMDYLRYFFTLTRYYAPVAPLLKECLGHLKSNTIIDLCSGGAGPIIQLQEELEKQHSSDCNIFLTDLYPNNDPCTYKKRESKGKIICITESVDAMNVPNNLIGLRTLFSSIHHFNPDEVRGILLDTVRSKQGIAIFDIGDKNLISALGIFLFHPILLFVLTPFFRPFRIETILFTYLIPVIPFCTVWDGIMSVLRLYTAEDLLKIAESISDENYIWKTGSVRNVLGLKVTYLTGIPKNI